MILKVFSNPWLYDSMILGKGLDIGTETHLVTVTCSTSPWQVFDPGHLASRQFMSMAWESARALAIPKRQEGILLWSLVA